MANQRKADKSFLGVFLHKSVKERMAETGTPFSSFTELAIIRELLRQDKITKETLAEMAAQRHLARATIGELVRDGTIP